MRERILSLGLVVVGSLGCYANSAQSVRAGMCVGGEIVARSNVGERSFWAANAPALCSSSCTSEVSLDSDNCTIRFVCSGTASRTVVGVLQPLSPDDPSDCRGSKQLFVKMFVDYGSDDPAKRTGPR